MVYLFSHFFFVRGFLSRKYDFFIFLRGLSKLSCYCLTSRRIRIHSTLCQSLPQLCYSLILRWEYKGGSSFHINTVGGGLLVLVVAEVLVLFVILVVVDDVVVVRHNFATH